MYPELEIIKGSEVEPKEIEWLWYPYIPVGKVTIINGDPGDGKSTFVLNLLARITRGGYLPFSDVELPPMNVIYQNTEDDLEDTVIPRFIRAGGDVDRIFFISEKEKALSFSDERIVQAIKETDAKVLIFDPLTSYIGADVSMNVANEVRSRFNHLIDAAKKTGCAIVIVGHMNKMQGTKALYRQMGSIDIVGSARSVLLIAPSLDDENNRVMAVEKCNLSERGKSIEFSVEDGRVEWLRHVDITADELVNSLSSSGSNRTETKQEQAKDILIDLLSEGGKPQQEVMKVMRQYDISKRTAENAKAELGIMSIKVGSAWLWRLPGKKQRNIQ